jgi:hypothetical protein
MICTGITYDSGSTKINVQYDVLDGTKGSSFTNPYTFEDIYDTDVANGWGVVEKQQNQYYINSVLETSGYGDTYFKDSKKIIIFNNPTETHLNVFQTSSNCDLNQCVFFMHNESFICSIRFILSYIDMEVYITSNVFRDFWGVSKSGNVISDKNTFYSLGSGLSITASAPSLTNLTLYNTLLQVRKETEIADNIKIYADNPVYLLPNLDDIVIEFRNLKVYENTINGTLAAWYNNTSVIFIDCNFNKEWDWHVWSTNTGDLTIYEKSTFNLDTNVDNVSVVIKDKDDNIIYDDIDLNDEEILYHKEYGKTVNGVYTDIDIFDYQPFNMLVSKDGFDDLIIPDIYVVPGEPTVIKGSLIPPKFNTTFYNSTLYNSNIY